MKGSKGSVQPADMSAQKSLPQPAQPTASAVNAAQTDGAGEWSAVRGQSYIVGDVEGRERKRADDLIRRKVEAAGEAMEGGGLLLPLRQRQRANGSRSRSGTGRRSGVPPNFGSALPAESLSTSSPTHPSSHLSSNPIAQYDGADDLDFDDAPSSGGGTGRVTIKSEEGLENVNDEDAINSELDDPEDEMDDNADEDDSMSQQMMLCMYDKVQRTKNKWKCVLKDGVLTVGGREYVFQRATGEFEW